MEKINFSGLSLKQKISQMIIVNGNVFDKRFTGLGVGGIFLDNLKTKKEYKETIAKYQNNSKIRLFVATDMEGYRNPFKNFYKSKIFGKIKNRKEAYFLGKEHGRILKELGFNLNFSPVVEIRNNVWPGRNFRGSLKEVKEKIKEYIKGLHKEKILATAKHYPGGSMVRDPHWLKFKTQVYKEDLELFDCAIKSRADMIMVGHPIVYGAVDSGGKQCTVSKEIVFGLRKKFNGLIITDAVTMLGLRWSYLFNFKKAYPELVKAGNDILLDTIKFSTYSKILKRINEIEKAVERGEISEERINESVRRILREKGYKTIK